MHRLHVKVSATNVRRVPDRPAPSKGASFAELRLVDTNTPQANDSRGESFRWA